MIKGYGAVKITEERTFFEGFAFDGYTSLSELVDWVIARLQEDLAKTWDPNSKESGQNVDATNLD